MCEYNIIKLVVTKSFIKEKRLMDFLNYVVN